MNTTDALATIDLPDHVHAEVQTARNPNGGKIAIVVVWSDRPSDRCPRCDEYVGLEAGLPAICEQFGDAQGVDLKHGCGEPLSSPWASVALADEQPDADELARVAATVAEMAADYDRATSAEDNRTRATLADELRSRIADYAAALADGEDEDDARARLSSDEYGERGVAWLNGHWEAWAPSVLGGEGEFIIVTEDDLAEKKD